MIGWIRMPGFENPIDYPVMQARDNDFYLRKDFYRNSSYAGSIFMDCRNNSAQVERNFIIYGHAMNNLSMFGNLAQYPKHPEEYTMKTKIYLDLMKTRLEYEVFSTYLTDASYNYRQTDFTGDDEFLSFLERIRSKSVYDYKIKLAPQDRILTLSTCNSSAGKDMRTVVHARLVRQVVYDKTAPVSPAAAVNGKSPKEVVSANTFLSGLSLSYGAKNNKQEAVFTPAFSTAEISTVRDFSTQLPPEADTAVLKCRTADPEASVYITLNGKKADPSLLMLNDGMNIISITVVSRDHLYSRAYTITAARLLHPEGTVGMTADTANK
jgi:SrtB family sortase